MMVRQRVILSGGPGSGKTTLLNALEARGYTIVNETARTIIQARHSRGLTSRPLPLEFAQEILNQDIEKYNQSYLGAGPLFFDRGILDALCMLNQVSTFQHGELEALIKKYPYNRQVFILPQWREIYTHDSERDQSFIESTQVYEMLKKWYHRCNYEVVEIPKLTITERCDFILQNLAN